MREPEPVRSVRERLALAATELFQTEGYIETTIDEIASHAGVGRRTFFRYYRTKEDVIFPDHDQLLLKVRARLFMHPEETGIAAATEAVKIVMREYVDTREISLVRYQLVNQVPALREREIVSVARYQRAFRERLAEGADASPGTALRAEVIAASIAAAHNQVLRRWLRGNGKTDPLADLENALGYVRDVFESAPLQDKRATRSPGIIVLAFDESTPTAAIVAELTKARANGTSPPRRRRTRT